MVSRISTRMETRLRLVGCLVIVTMLTSVSWAQEKAAEVPPIRVGIIGLDTSHSIAFTKVLNAENPPPEFAHCRVVAAYPKGSPDIKSSTSRVPRYTEQIQQLGMVQAIGRGDCSLFSYGYNCGRTI